MSALVRTVLLPWLFASAAILSTSASWAEAATVSLVVLAVSLGSTWTAVRERRRQLARGEAALRRVQEREAAAVHTSGVLHAELARLRQHVVDPRVDARRERLRALGLAVELGIGDRRVPVRLRDLTLSELWLELPRSEAERWCPGLPVRVTLQHEGRTTILGWAVAGRPLRLPPDAPPTWQLRWREALREHELPRAVWRATMDREAHRVCPHPETRVWVGLPGGDRVALITNLSANGLGLSLPMGLREAGRLPRHLVVSLQLPELDAPLELPCEVIHLDVRPSGTAIGLALDPHSPRFAEVQPRLAAHVMRRDAQSRIRLVS